MTDLKEKKTDHGSQKHCLHSSCRLMIMILVTYRLIMPDEKCVTVTIKNQKENSSREKTGEDRVRWSVVVAVEGRGVKDRSLES